LTFLVKIPLCLGNLFLYFYCMSPDNRKDIPWPIDIEGKGIIEITPVVAGESWTCRSIEEEREGTSRRVSEIQNGEKE